MWTSEVPELKWGEINWDSDDLTSLGIDRTEEKLVNPDSIAETPEIKTEANYKDML